MKLSKKILMSLVAVTCAGTFHCSAALPIGTNSIAEGEGAIATGKNSVAVGTGAVATGDNLTGEKIKNILKENEANLKHIEDLKKQVQQTELDFQKKYEIYMRVEAAKKKIEANNKLLAEKLRPELDAANQNYNTFKPGYDNAVNEMNQRLSLISNLDFTLIAKDPTHGLDTLAQELKEKSEKGYAFSNDISFYKTYIQNYIKAKGDLANNKEIYSTSYYYFYDILCNTLANPSRYGIKHDFLAFGNSSKMGTAAVEIDKQSKNSLLDLSPHSYYEFNGKSFYINDKTAALSKKDLDAWTAKKAELFQNGLEVINGQKSIFVDKTTKQGLTDKLQAHLDYADYMFHAKYEQNCYNEAKAAGNESEALTHLQKKIEYENKAQKLKDEWDGDAGKSKKLANYYQETKESWKKTNIDDIENSNTLAVDTLRKQYLATLDAQKKKLDELQHAIDQATAAIESKEKENKQLKPTPEDEAEAKKAEATKQKLEAEKQALKEALEHLKLNDLTDIGTNAIAYGTNSLVTGRNAIGIGTDELVTGEDSIGIGRKNTVSGTQSVAIGTENTVAGNNSGAMGTNNSVLANDSFVVGKNNSINKETNHNFILGNDVIISGTVSNSVILGDHSTLSAPAKVGSVIPYGVISVGSKGKERQIQNVAPGRIEASSTDAVNGSQLYELAQNPSTATGMNKENWQQFLGDGTNTSGSKGLVTGDTLYKAIQSIDVTDQIAGKADTDLKNITDDGKTVIKNIAKDSVKVVDGTNTTVTETTDKDGNKNYAVNVEANGKIAENDTGIVNGNTVYQAIKDKADKTDITNAVKDKADVNAGNVTGENKKAWQEKLGDGKIAAGDKGLVNGDTVNNAINNIKNDVNTSLDGKADTDLKNITNDGKTVIKNIAKDSVKVVDGMNTTVTETTDKDGNKNYAVNVEATGKNEEGNTGLINGDTLYKAIKDVDVSGQVENKADTDLKNITDDGKTVIKDIAKSSVKVVDGKNTTVTESTDKDGNKNYAVNVEANGKIEKNNNNIVTGGAVYQAIEDKSLVKTDGNTISIDRTGTANVIDVSHTVNGKSEGRVITGVVTDPGNPYSAANVSYVNTSISNVLQEMTSGMSRLEKDVSNVGAGSAALSALEYDEIEPGQKWQIAAGVGNYKGSTAYALGAKYHLNKDISFHIGSTIGNGNNMVNGGFSIALGHAKKKIDDDGMKRLDAMQKEINDLKEQNKQLIQALEKVNKLFLLNPSKKAAFPDVPADHWAKNAVDVLHGNGAIEGYPDGNFKGDRKMSRYEYAEMLYNALMNGAAVDESVVEKYQPELVQIYSEKNR